MFKLSMIYFQLTANLTVVVFGRNNWTWSDKEP